MGLLAPFDTIFNQDVCFGGGEFTVSWIIVLWMLVVRVNDSRIVRNVGSITRLKVVTSADPAPRHKPKSYVGLDLKNRSRVYIDFCSQSRLV